MPRALRFVLLTVMIDSIGFGIVMPVLPGLIRSVSGGSLPEATRIGGWLGLAYAGMQFLCGPLAGNLGDRFGRRPVLLAALAGLGCDYLLLGFAPNLWWLLAGRLIAGVFGASWTPAWAAVADLSEPENRARQFGFVSAAFGIGFIIGPAIGGLLGEVSPRAPFWMAAALSASNFTYGLILFPETLPLNRRRPLDLARANPFGALRALRQLHGVLPLALVYFAWITASMVYPSTWAFYAPAAFGWGPGMVGASLALVGLLMALNQTLLLGRVLKAFGERGAFMFGLADAVIVFGLFAVLRNGWLALIALVLSALHAVVQPSIMAMLSHRVPPNAQGELQGFTGSLAALASIGAPLLFNGPLAYFTSGRAPGYFPGAPFVVAGTMALVSLLLFLFIAPPAAPATVSKTG